jgi:hypothetical protein
MMRNPSSSVFAAFLLQSLLCAQEAGAPAPSTTKPDPIAAFKKLGIDVDLQAKTARLKAKMSRPIDLLEYVLITRQGKAHEALLTVEVQPSILNAALLALGLTPGTNVQFKEKDPPPSEEEVRNGVDWLIITPPAGPQVWFTLAWTDAEGKAHEHALEDLVMDLATGEGIDGGDWIYIGGRTAEPYRGEPPVFLADLEGNLASCCYLDPANHLFTLRHERARSDQNWWMTEACPETGTQMQLTIHLSKPEVVRAREERIAKERAAGKQPKGPPKELPAQPASSDNPPPVKREEGKKDK